MIAGKDYDDNDDCSNDDGDDDVDDVANSIGNDSLEEFCLNINDVHVSGMIMIIMTHLH